MDHDPRHALGQSGEWAADAWLSGRGLQILARHYRTPMGEIDLILRDGQTLVFVEVKTRAKCWMPGALDAITPAKRRRIVRSAIVYIRHKRLEGMPVRFDVLTIEDGCLRWIPDAFMTDEFFTL